MKKLDIHCHTTNRQVNGRSASLDKVISEMKTYDIEKTVLLATYFPHRGSGISNFRLFSWIKDKPEFQMFGSLDFEHYFFQGLNELSELGELGYLSGIKIYTGYQNIDLNSNKTKEITKLAKKLEIPVMFHCGYSYSAMSSLGKIAITEVAKPTDLEFLAKENPEVNFIFSHMAKPFLEDLIKVVNRNNNVYTDSSGLLDFDSDQKEKLEVADEIKQFLHECGSEKLLFGTDFPVQTHEDSIFLIENSMKDFSDSDKLKVYNQNAKNLLNRGKEK